MRQSFERSPIWSGLRNVIARTDTVSSRHEQLSPIDHIYFGPSASMHYN